jgi:AcrR family transcriptional regulator
MDIRTRILEAALRVFAETGYRGATTRRIAQEADVNEVTLFRNFGSKEELMRAAVQHEAELDQPAALPAHPDDPYEELTAWAREHHGRLYARSSVLRACLGESSEHPDMTNCVNAGPIRAGAELRRYLRLVRDQYGTQGIDVEVAAAMLMSVLFTDAIGRDVMPELYRFPLEEAPDRYAEFVLTSLGVTRSRHADQVRNGGSERKR